MAVELSVIVPNYRRPDLLMRCLRSLREASRDLPFEVEFVVVDDGSDDDSCRLVSEGFPEFALVAMEQNRGYPAAVNEGLRASSGEWILTLNNDTTVEPGALQELMAVARRRPDVGSVAAQQRFMSHPHRIYSAGVTVDRRGQASDRLIGHLTEDGEREPIRVFAACGAAALYRRSMLEQLGGFDERFLFGLEDVDVAWRAQMRGWCCMYAPKAIVYHDLGGTVAHGSELRFVQAGRNRLLLIAKNMTTRELLRNAIAIALFDLLYVAYGVLRLRTFSPVRGRWEGLRMWRTIRRSGAEGRCVVELAPPASFQEILRRRRAWRFASEQPAPEDSQASNAAVAWR